MNTSKLKKKVLITPITMLCIGLFVHAMNAEATDFGKMFKDAIAKGVRNGLNQPKITQDNNLFSNNGNTVTSSGHSYSGPTRWDVDNQTIDKLAQTAIKEAMLIESQFNHKYVQQDMKTFSSTWSLLNSSSIEHTFYPIGRDNNVASYKTPLLVCTYLEPKQPYIESGSTLPQNMTIGIIYWKVGTRAELDSRLYHQEGWDGHADAEVSVCPKDLETAMETGFGAEIWALKKLQYKVALQEKIKYFTKVAPKLEEQYQKSLNSKSESASDW